MSIWTVVREVLRDAVSNNTEMLSCVLPRQVADGKSAAGGRYSKTHTYCGLLRRMHSDYGQQSHKDKRI